MQTITLAITNFNRTTELLDSFIRVVNDDRISEILICDDYSDTATGIFLTELCNESPKIWVEFSGENIGMSRNKAKAIALASNEWCILFDSDNILDKQYIDSIYAVKTWSPDTIYNPSYARPHFDFRHFAGRTLRRGNIRKYHKMRNFDSMINVCNYFVNRKSYLANFVHDESIKGTDTSFFLYNWLKRGNKFHIVRGMEYEHKVHDGSEFLKNLDYNMQKGDEIKKMMLSL